MNNKYPQTTQITIFPPSADREITPWFHFFRGSTFFPPVASLISTKNRAMAQQLAVKTSPTADLHHVDVIAHTTPITATNSLNCRQ